MLSRKLFGLFCNDFSDQTRVKQVVSSTDEGLNELNNPDVKQVVPKTISPNYQDIVVIYFVALDITACRVISSSTNLIGKVESVLLFFGPIDLDQIQATLSEQQISRITQIASMHNWFKSVNCCDGTSAASCLLGFGCSVNQ